MHSRRIRRGQKTCGGCILPEIVRYPLFSLLIHPFLRLSEPLHQHRRLRTPEATTLNHVMFGVIYLGHHSFIELEMSNQPSTISQEREEVGVQP